MATFAGFIFEWPPGESGALSADNACLSIYIEHRYKILKTNGEFWSADEIPTGQMEYWPYWEST